MDTDYPKISIIIPSLNQGIFIEATIRSVLSQEYPSLEILVFDGGSSDETVSVLKRFDGQIYWVSQKDNGQTDAINRGLRTASGEIVTYLNADDLLLPGSLERVAKEFNAHPQLLWLTGRCRIIDEQNLEIRKVVKFYKNVLLRTHNPYVLMTTNYISQPATFWRRSAMEQAGWLDEKLHYVMDYDYWLRLWKLGSPLIIHRELAAFRVHMKSKTTSTAHLEQYILEEEQVINQHTRSQFWRRMHTWHRYIMTFFYARINR